MTCSLVILKVNCSVLKLYRKLRKMFLSPRRESNPQHSDLRSWDALTIELSGLRCRDVPDTTLPDTGFNRIVIYRITDSSKFKHNS